MPLSIRGLELKGDADFQVSPEALATRLESGASVDLDAVFSPVTGGLRGAELVIESDDVRQPRLFVRLSGTGDAARLCLCIGSASERCVPTASADFGRVSTGASAFKYLRLASCGTKPLTLTRVEVTEGAGEFSVQAGSLGAGVTLAPGERHPDLPIEFTPTIADKAFGKLAVESDVEQGFVSLSGEGVASGCRLEAPSNLIDFGQVAQQVESRRDYLLANRGTSDCVIPAAPSITSGALVSFALAGFPALPATIPSGQTVKFVVSYTPKDDQGPDEGELSVPYADGDGAVATSNLSVQLRGTPSSTAECVLAAAPGGAAGRSLNFGQVLKNTEKVLPVTFQNIGSSDCRIASWNIVGSSMLGITNDASYFTVKQPPNTVVRPGETTTIGVAFQPDAERTFGTPLGGLPGTGNFSVQLLVQTSDTARFGGGQCASGLSMSGPPGCVGWKLSGEGVASSLRVLPGDIDFGLVTLGCQSREMKVTVYNVGRNTVHLLSFTVDPPAPPPPGVAVFRVRAPSIPAGGLPLGPGAQMSLTVIYKPPDAALHTGTLFIESDAVGSSGTNPFLSVGLSGTGSTASHQSDSFTQASQAKTDVLFVVDNSASMGEEQSHLGDNASTFLDVAQQLNADFQVGVVTTDMDAATQQGRLQTTNQLPRITVPGTSAATNLRSIVRSLGTRGSITERGLDAMVAALSAPLVNDPASNAGLVRPDARLAVVLVSDEDDQSSASVDYFVDFLQNLKGAYNASMVSFSAIVGDPYPSVNSLGTPGCTSTDGDADWGERYVEVSRRTGGKFRSICSSDWGRVASDLGLDAFAARSGFALSRPADPATVKVSVNGQPSTQGQWSLDPSSNTIVFASQNVPPASANVVVEYDALCQ